VEGKQTSKTHRRPAKKKKKNNAPQRFSCFLLADVLAGFAFKAFVPLSP
jgi:hypothetical protein